MQRKDTLDKQTSMAANGHGNQQVDWKTEQVATEKILCFSPLWAHAIVLSSFAGV